MYKSSVVQANNIQNKYIYVDNGLVYLILEKKNEKDYC